MLPNSEQLEVVERLPRLNETFDTTQHLRNARVQADERGYDAFTIVDVDAHHYETESWADIIQYMDDDVLRHYSQSAGVGSTARLLPLELGNQDLSGRIIRYPNRAREQPASRGSKPRDAIIVRKAMDAMGIDYQVLFPTPMLNLGLHPRKEVEVGLAWAYARWITEVILPADPGIVTMLYLPFSFPEACVDIVKRFADTPGVVGFMVTGVRYAAVHDNSYMTLYHELEDRQMPLGFHAGYSWRERAFEQLNKFISVHSLAFPLYNMIHVVNWIINGIPERFPGLKVIWIEGGLAWIPFLMQRLDNEYKMRTSEAPMLTRLPSDYMKDMYFTSQPMERPDDLETLKHTFDMIHADSQLLYSSDYPHWDFDLPSTIYDLPFLSEATKRRILGGNACDLFRLPPRPVVT